MKHKISITTVEALVINKALRMDLQNEVDNEIARQIIDRINLTVKKDLKEKEQKNDSIWLLWKENKHIENNKLP